MDVVNPVIKRWRYQAEADFEGFWARAAEAVPWFRKWDTVFEATPPTFRWFSGALTNLSHNCLDHHVGRGWGGHAALVTENERGEQRVLTYAQMLGAVEAVAAGLRRSGVRRGDRVATSGTTAKPKLAVHHHGPYQVGIASAGKWLFDLTPVDVWWSTSDIGWIVGHSYIVYAPLLAGCTTIAYEGALDHPGPERFYGIVEENGVNGVFTSPTATRMLMRYGVEPARRHDLGSLTRVFCAGEVLNAPAWEWLQKEALQNRVPVIDHMWQTETAGPVFGNPWGLGMLPIKPGSAGIALPGIEAEVLTPEGGRCGPNEKGIMVIRRPFPGLTATQIGRASCRERGWIAVGGG